ncbi:hypothetical protein MRX96_054607 [Rhipicephalus microplus]
MPGFEGTIELQKQQKEKIWNTMDDIIVGIPSYIVSVWKETASAGALVSLRVSAISATTQSMPSLLVSRPACIADTGGASQVKTKTMSVIAAAVATSATLSMI